MPPRRLATPAAAPIRWTRRAVWLIASLNIVVLVLAIAPFLLWAGFGPDRFDELALGNGGGGLRTEVDQVDPWLTATNGALADGDRLDGVPFDLSPTTRVTLVFSVGAMDMTREEADRLRVPDLGRRGGDGLTDSMMLLIGDRRTGAVAMLSVPRDLWLFDRGHRINATFNRHGLQAFVDDVARVTGLPIHHVVQVNFAAFAQLVDAIGGVAIQVDRPLADRNAHLYIPDAGCWRFDGADALAWTRSRFTLTRTSRGTWVNDRTASDFGRIDRQQDLLRTAWDRVRSPSMIRSLPDLLGTVRRGLVVDNRLGVQEVRDLLASFRDVPAGRFEGATLPTSGRRISRAAAQVLDTSEAREVLGRLRTWPPEPETSPSDQPTAVVSADATIETPSPDPAPDPSPAAEERCTLATAQPLPEPWAYLEAIRPPRPTPVPDQDATPEPFPTEDATEQPTDEPTDQPTEEPTEDPDPEPTESETEPRPRLPLPIGPGD